MSRQPIATDPREMGPKPPFPAQEQQPVGSERKMEPEPDYGETSYQGHGRMKGKVALITGGDSGIGRAVALAFVREGADVLISYLDEHADAKKTVEVCEKEEGRRCVAVPGDLADPAHCEALVDRCISEFGRLDVLVNNAAYQMTFNSIREVSAEELEKTYRTNVFAMFHLSKKALERLPPGGAIINTTSIQAYQPSPPLIPYSTTKGAILTFTKALAEEAIKQGVRVNAVAPGPVWTPLIPYSFPGEHVAEFGGDTPIGRPAQPAELAPTYVFLATPDSSYIVGERIGVTGGKPLP
ncbi:SDR family oxidoreductase [Alienimonas sp. DA493]|uniref:SDR family oxidoreductase n=1 Tax=Alienimonas sp. DA493 TaxID=3373605 RepID=UPI0037548A59